MLIAAAASIDEIISVKNLAESIKHSTIPSNFIIAPISSSHLETPITVAAEEEESIPVIDVSMLTSNDANQRSKVVQDLEKACRDWGIFMVVNHGVAEKQMREMVDLCREFFNLKDEEKLEYKGKHAMDSITYGSSVHGSTVGNLFLWRDFLKCNVHPKFHSPNKPLGFSKAMEDYTGAIRKISRLLLGGISESLGLEASHIGKAMNVESSYQLFATNLYPTCPQPELTMGIPSHTDHGLLTFLISNGVDGLQFQHNGKWINATPAPGAFIVNVADHIQILTNGKYKSCVHRAVVNNKLDRISIAVSYGPSVDTVVGPLPELIDETHPPAYASKRFIDYMEHQFNKKAGEKSGLDHVKII